MAVQSNAVDDGLTVFAVVYSIIWITGFPKEKMPMADPCFLM